MESTTLASPVHNPPSSRRHIGQPAATYMRSTTGPSERQRPSTGAGSNVNYPRNNPYNRSDRWPLMRGWRLTVTSRHVVPLLGFRMARGLSTIVMLICGALTSTALAQDATTTIPSPLSGLFAGGSSQSGRSDSCRVDTASQFRMRVLPTGRVRWWSQTSSGIECSDGPSIPTSCNWSGTGTLTPIAGRTVAGGLSLEISDVGSAPPPIETHLLEWRCGATRRILPDSIQHPSGCVLLGTPETDWSRTAANIAERACQEGQPFTAMDHLTLRADRGGQYRLLTGRTILMTLGRIEESPEEVAAAEAVAERTIRINHCRAARERVYELMEEFYNGEGFPQQPINAALDQSRYCQVQYRNGFQWGPRPVNERWLNRCTAEFDAAETAVRSACICSDWPSRSLPILCSPASQPARSVSSP